MSDIGIEELEIDTSALEIEAAGEGSEPLSSITSNYDPHKAMVKYEMNKEKLADRYKFEKAMGVRLENGAMPLKNVTPRHMRILSNFLSGAGVNQIAIRFHCRASTVSRILHDPRIKSVIEISQENYDQELKALLPLAVEAIRDALCHSDPKIRLQAVDRFARMTGKGSDPLVNEPKTINVENLRIAFINQVREIAEDYKIIDALPESSS